MGSPVFAMTLVRLLTRSFSIRYINQKRHPALLVQSGIVLHPFLYASSIIGNLESVILFTSFAAYLDDLERMGRTKFFPPLLGVVSDSIANIRH